MIGVRAQAAKGMRRESLSKAAWSLSQGEVIIDGSKGSWSRREERSFGEKVVSRHKWKTMGVRAQAVKGIRRESYVEQHGQSVKEKSLSMGREDLGVGEKKEASVRR